MNPNNDGWLKEYLQFRNSHPHKEVMLGSHPDESLYRLIQPTGIMYGQPVNAVAHPDMERWSPKSKMKILLLESLLNSAALFFKQDNKTGLEDESIVSKIGNFYIDVYPELSISKTSFFGKKKHPLDVAEKVINKRILINFDQKRNFWSRFFNNSLLFVDIYLFGQWIHTSADKMVVNFLREEKTDLYNMVCKIISAAAHSNKNIEEEERKLFHLFVNSTGLSSADKKTAMALFNKGLSLLEINLDTNIPWILKKYYLELATLTIWADKKVEESEMKFLHELNDFLGFNEDDFENSMIAVEAFVIKYWNELDYLQNKRNFEIVSERFVLRMRRVIEKNHFRITRAIKDNPELKDMIIKATYADLSQQEINYLEKHLLQALKTIPSFSIIELPDNFMEFDVIKKIIPENIMEELSKEED